MGYMGDGIRAGDRSLRCESLKVTASLHIVGRVVTRLEWHVCVASEKGKK